MFLKICFLQNQHDGGLLKNLTAARGAAKISSFEFQYLLAPLVILNELSNGFFFLTTLPCQDTCRLQPYAHRLFKYAQDCWTTLCLETVWYNLITDRSKQ